MNKMLLYGNDAFGRAVSYVAANSITSRQDFVVDPIAGNFRTFWGLGAENIVMGEPSRSVHHAQFTLLNYKSVSDDMVRDAMKKVQPITTMEQYKFTHNEYYRRELDYWSESGTEAAVMFLRMAFSLSGSLLWGKDGKLIPPSRIYAPDNGQDFLLSNIFRARELAERARLFSYGPELPHEILRTSVFLYKEIEAEVDKFVVFTVLPPYQAKKADIVTLTEKPWLENERNLFMEEISSILQELGNEASVFLVMMDVVAAHEYLQRWPVKIKSLTSLAGHNPYAVFELEKE